MSDLAWRELESRFEQAEEEVARLRGRAEVAEAAARVAYRERARLVAFLAAWFPSHIGHNDPNEPEWAVLTIETAAGQMAWHIAPDDMDLFGHVQPTPHFARDWDGHTTEEKYERLAALADRGRRYEDIARHLEQLPVLVSFTRRSRGLNLRETGEQCDVAFNTLSRLERGVGDLALSSVISILRWLDGAALDGEETANG